MQFCYTLALSTAAAAAAAPLGQQFLQGCTCNANYPMPMSMFTAVFGSRHGLKTGIFASPVLCQLACGAELGDWPHPASSAGVSSQMWQRLHSLVGQLHGT